MLKPVKRQQRKRKDCPVPGCTSLGLLQLHNHLNCVHRYNEKDRKYWLSIGRLQKSGVLTKELISRENGKRRSHDFSQWYKPRNGFIQNHCTGSETGEEEQDEGTQGWYAPKVATRCTTESTQTNGKRETKNGETGSNIIESGSDDTGSGERRTNEWYDAERHRIRESENNFIETGNDVTRSTSAGNGSETKNRTVDWRETGKPEIRERRCSGPENTTDKPTGTAPEDNGYEIPMSSSGV